MPKDKLGMWFLLELSDEEFSKIRELAEKETGGSMERYIEKIVREHVRKVNGKKIMRVIVK
jgi:hypothetical protein